MSTTSLSPIYIVTDDPSITPKTREPLPPSTPFNAAHPYFRHLLKVLDETSTQPQPPYIHIRAKKSYPTTAAYKEFINIIFNYVPFQFKRRLIVSISDPEATEEIIECLKENNGGGIHLSGTALEHLAKSSATDSSLSTILPRCIPAHYVVTASCHTVSQLLLSQYPIVKADFVVLSPVLPSITCPSEAYLGWDGFQKLIQEAEEGGAAEPQVYALGGVNSGHVDEARRRGGVGVAAIASFWHDEDFGTVGTE